MYTIFADGECIYSDVTPLETCKVVNPKLKLADSAAGSLELTLPPGNAGYNLVKRLTTDIVVYENDEELWEGRILEETIDFWKRKIIYCEGELAYLNDTIQPPHQYSVSDTTITSFLTDLLAVHNSKVPENRQFQIGIVTVIDGDQIDDDDAINRFTNYESTLECINTKLVEKLGGHLRVRHQNGVRYLDYLKDYPGSTSQEIQFGSNLLDFSTNFTAENIATVIIPRGARLDESPIEGLEAYLTVESVNEGSIYVASEAGLRQYGRVETVVDWENVTNANTLLTKAQKYLTDEQFNEMELTISAVDLHYLNPAIESIKLLDQVHCVSYAHTMPDEMYTDWNNVTEGHELKVNDRVTYEGNLYKVIQDHSKSTSLVPTTAYEYFEMVFAGKILDKMFPVTEIEMDLSDPSQTIYTMGTKVNLSLTQASSKTNSDLINQINSIPSKSSILEAARKNAFNILTGTEGGYVSFDKNADDQIIDIKITNQLEEERSTKKWLWNQGGLGYMERTNPSDNWQTVKTAITMDGGIVAERVTAGRLYGQTVEGAKIAGSEIGNGDNADTTTINILAPSGIRLAFGSKAAWQNGCNVITSSSNRNCHDGFGTKRLGTNDGCFLHWETVRRWDEGQGVYGDEAVFVAPSDRRLKENIQDIDPEKIRQLFLKLNMVQFSFKQDTINHRIRYGLIAQDTEKVLEEVGLTKEDMVHDRGDGYLKIEYEQVERLAIQAVKDLYQRVEELEREIDILKKEDK